MHKWITLARENKLIVFVWCVSLLVAAALTVNAGKPVTISIPNTDVTHVSGVKTIPSLSYSGVTGIDALSLLKRKSQVIQDHTGLVTGIDGVVASASHHTYWAFYVNGKLSDVGPAQYKTKNTDMIVWKIKNY